jgi:hypothetical protein
VQQEPGTGGFSQKNVAQTEENERNGSATSATDVADSKRNSSSERNGNNSTKSSTVADVADVAVVPGIRRDDRICAQCNAGGEPLARVDGVDPPVWLHPECRRFWFKDHPEADGIPQIMRRAPALGPEGDTINRGDAA